jgi:hypothetical protein
MVHRSCDCSTFWCGTFLKRHRYPPDYTWRECAGFIHPASSTVKITVNFVIEIRVMNTNAGGIVILFDAAKGDKKGMLRPYLRG